MSQKFEHIFKEALQNQEVPYDAAAWSAMSAKLDKVKPVTVKKPFVPKAALIIAVGLIGAASVYFIATSEKEVHNENTLTEQTAENSNNSRQETNLTTSTSTKEESNNSNSSLNLKTTEQNINVPNTIKGIEFRGPGYAQASNPSTNPNPEIVSIIPDNNQITPLRKIPINDPTPEGASLNTSLPVVSNACQHMSKEISNKSDVKVNVEYPSGKAIAILPNSSKKIEFDEAGKYIISNANGSESSFTIHESTSADFSIDSENLYKNGVPTTEVKLLKTGITGEWTSSKGNQSYSGSSADFHFFKKGNYQINVTTTNSKGCASATSKTIKVEDDYNLLAVTAFKPQEIDPRVNTFMPQALKDRNTPFSLIIIDPKDGNVVYQTTDASAGWDGIDRRTGKPAVHGTNYIWKVSLTKPMIGEGNEYKGIVTIIID